MRKRAWIVASAVLAAAALAPSAGASRLIARNAHDVELKVGRDGTALVNFSVAGGRRHLLAWGAINARHPQPGTQQVHFKFDYAGGWGRYHKTIWPHFRSYCRPYDGPPLAWLVTACKAPDGSYWALQSWQPALPDLGFTPWLASQRVWELHLSHWTGSLAKLEVYQDWTYEGRFRSVFGRVTYRGRPVYGYKADRYGAPQDRFSRLVYVDTFNSAFGRGWRRDNSFLLHTGKGIFCHGFYAIDPSRGYPGYPRTGIRPPGHGERYRITVNGPGVTPDVVWQGKGLPAFDRSDATHVALEQQMDSLLDSWGANRSICHR